MPSVREIVKEAQIEIRDTADLLPDRASELLNRLTAVFGNVLDEVRKADAEYKRVLLACLKTNEKANRARIEAETSPEYARWREARDIERLTEEMIRSLKVFLKSKTEEMRLAR